MFFLGRPDVLPVGDLAVRKVSAGLGLDVLLVRDLTVRKVRQVRASDVVPVDDLAVCKVSKGPPASCRPRGAEGEGAAPLGCAATWRLGGAQCEEGLPAGRKHCRGPCLTTGTSQSSTGSTFKGQRQRTGNGS